MRSQRYLLAPVLAMMAGLTAPMAMAENRIDTQLPNAPDMAAYGNMGVGVRQIDLVNTDQIDILAIDPKAPKPETMPRYDRPLAVEVWYPAADGATGDTALKAFIRDGKTEVTLQGKAMRDAEPHNPMQPIRWSSSRTDIPATGSCCHISRKTSRPKAMSSRRSTTLIQPIAPRPRLGRLW